MTPKVKICGLRRPEDIDFANRLRPDVVGFVFAAGSPILSPLVIKVTTYLGTIFVPSDSHASLFKTHCVELLDIF